jgi:hypothetical protein
MGLGPLGPTVNQHAGCFEWVDLVLFDARVAAILAFAFKMTILSHSSKMGATVWNV